MRWLFVLPVVMVVLLTSCGHRTSGVFRVLPAIPNYLLRSPDGFESPFPEILRRYNGFEPGRSGMDLRPQMELRIENAYYQAGMPKRGLDGYLGTEVARYRVESDGVESDGGLKLLSILSMIDRPPDQAPVEQLIPAAQRRYRYHHFFYEVLFRSSSFNRGSVILGADSTGELTRLTALMATEPETICQSNALHCTVFPEACSVSVEMQIVLNGTSRSVIWASTLASVVKPASPDYTTSSERRQRDARSAG